MAILRWYPWLLYINTQAMWNSTDYREFGTFQFIFPHTQQLIVQLTKDKGQRKAYKTVDATKDKISGAINHKI